jgi:hypothetical protein
VSELLFKIQAVTVYVQVLPNFIYVTIYNLDTMRGLVGKVERRARKPWITQEMISKMDERRKWKNVNNEEGRKKYRRLRNELKRATDNAKKELSGEHMRRDHRISKNRTL